MADSLELLALRIQGTEKDTLEAVAAYRKAAALYSSPALNEHSKALRCYATICSMTQRSALADTGVVYARLADPILSRYQHTMSAAEVSYVQRNLAFTFLDMKDLDRARNYATIALEKANSTGEIEAIDRSRDVLAAVYQEIGAWKEAIAMERLLVASINARNKAAQLDAREVHRRLANAHTALGDCFKLLGRMDSSFVHTKLAYEHTRAVDTRSIRLSSAAINLANFYFFQGYFDPASGGLDSAVDYVDRAIRAIPAGDPQAERRESDALYWKALAFQMLGKPDSALAVMRQCPRNWLSDPANAPPIDWGSRSAPSLGELDGWSTVAENMFTEFGDTTVFALVDHLMTEAIRGNQVHSQNIDPASLRNDYNNRVSQYNRYLNFQWRARANGFDWNRLTYLFEARKADQLRTWLRTLEAGSVPGESRTTYQALLARRSMLDGSSTDPEVLAQLAALSSSIDSVSRRLKLDPVGSASMNGVGYCERIVDALDDSTLIMNYAWADDMNGAVLNILVLSKEHREFEQRQLRPVLDSLLTLHQQNVRQGDLMSVQTTGVLLGDSLLPAVLSNGRFKRVIILPEGPLSDLPFETLMLRRGNTTLALIDIAEVRYEYGMGFIPDPKAPTSAELGILACAPSFDGTANAAGSGDPQRSLLNAEPALLRNGIAPLKENIAEASALVERYGATALQGGSATESSVCADLSQFNVLHFATHAICSDSIPELSGILLSGAFAQAANDSPNTRSINRSDGNDNVLHAYEIRSQQLRADLVVLSACETGIGKDQSGEGTMSLARAFRFAGAKNVVSSLWKVDDLATKEIMVKFYEKLAEGLGKADALAAAKRWYRKTYPDEPPSKWAAFILIGDNEPVHLIKRSPIRPWMWALGIGILVGGAFLIVRGRRHRMAA